MATTRNLTGASTIPAGVAQVGTVTSATGNPRILTRTTATIWISGGVVSAGLLRVWEGKVYKNKTGTNTTAEPQNDTINWEIYSPDPRSYIWLYVPDSDGAGLQKVAKITGVGTNLNERNSTYQELYYVDRDLATTGAKAFELVVGNLTTYSLENNGGSDGTFDGAVFKSGTIFNADREQFSVSGYRLKDVKTVSGSGTNFYIIENT